MVVKERERELEMARLELRAAECAHDVLERKLDALLSSATARDPCPAARSIASSKLSTHGPVRASVGTWTPRETSSRDSTSSSP